MVVEREANYSEKIHLTEYDRINSQPYPKYTVRVFNKVIAKVFLQILCDIEYGTSSN